MELIGIYKKGRRIAKLYKYEGHYIVTLNKYKKNPAEVHSAGSKASALEFIMDKFGLDVLA